MSAAVSSFLAIGIVSWGFPFWPLVVFPPGAGLLYMITLTVIQKPWRGRKQRLAARRREWEAAHPK